MEKEKNNFSATLEKLFGLDLRSLALFRVGLALVIIVDLIIRAGDLRSLYSDAGVMPRTLLKEITNPFYWSINSISGEPFVQGLIFLIVGLIAIALLVGYRTRLATIAMWAFVISIQNRNPALSFAADHVLRALLFWAMFLPLGASYSIDSALNSSQEKLPKRIASAATVALMIQIVLIYAGSAAYKTKSEIWWPDGDAVYYALSFDGYATPFGQFLLGFPEPILKLLTWVALWFEWLGPLMIFIPVGITFFRCVSIVLFILLHISFGLSFELGVFPYLCVVIWLVFIPTEVWDNWEKKIQSNERQGLRIYYDADCGFCKKVVYLLRTFLILPGTPLTTAQTDESIYADMQEKNSWVVVDWQGNRHFKWEALVYVFSLSPIFKPLAFLMGLSAIMPLGTKFYESIANNRKFAGNFTKPFKFRPLDIRPYRGLNVVVFLLLIYTLTWNVKGFVRQTYQRRKVQQQDFIAKAHTLFRRKTFQRLDVFGKLTKLDQSWSIFAPAPPRDDGWHVISGKLKNGKEVDVLYEKGESISWDKPTMKQFNNLYENMQWRSYFITLNRAIGKKLYPYYAEYVCSEWNKKNEGSEKLESLDIFFMEERTVPPGETQIVEKKNIMQKSCSDEQKDI
ncbi:MAG: HTTM domain-containing protein [Okeania sp. SIO2C9]|uniref:HTTM domain-containing protein n=1 Tax=Okeania sp. SIO2C9 TaxID=2607791 RepID=UPI0013C0697D|nr:HTTM domain-containing protein [Okeania sp. SIO2C9]NEQ74501.1 HTTM domain-containing protein [Okeania sp. SIO2C9]